MVSSECLASLVGKEKDDDNDLIGKRFNRSLVHAGVWRGF